MMPSRRVRRNLQIDSKMLEHASVSITLHTSLHSPPDTPEKSAQPLKKAYLSDHSPPAVLCGDVSTYEAPSPALQTVALSEWAIVDSNH